MALTGMTEHYEISSDSLGPCPICEREMIKGKMVDKHHLIPKSKKGKETVYLHKICHRKLHATFSEKELEKKYYVIEVIREHPEIQKFIIWVSNKPLDFYDSTRDSNNRNNKRKYTKG